VTGKIAPTHLARQAYVYVRQSSLAQVIEHEESRRRQCELSRRAGELGWPAAQIRVLDEDLGRSAKEAEDRSGFQTLAQAVARGEVGAIFALEVSRVARCSADWQQLLRVCRVTEVLIADEHAVYDPRDANDRLILGVKGMMSESELDWMALRLHGARLSRARRGEYRLGLPTGYVWSEAGRVTVDPDEEIRRALALVFERFRLDGSVPRVVRFLVEHGLTLPCRVRWRGGHTELRWVRPRVGRVHAILRNPTYAGAYVYGRKACAHVVIDGRIRSRVRALGEVAEWAVCLPGHQPGYISWEEYLMNRKRLRANAGTTVGTPRAPRDGGALLAGLLLCGRCGRPMGIRYPGKRERCHFYICGPRPTAGATAAVCWQVAGPRIDRAVVDLFLCTMVPEELEVSLAVEREVERQAGELDRQWRLRLERAQYEAELAERRYKAVDPANRTVARTLEREWEAGLTALTELRSEYAQVRHEKRLVLSAEDRAAIRALARDLPAVWTAPSTTVADRKQLLRLVIEQIGLQPLDVPSRSVRVRVLWKTGAETTLGVERPRTSGRRTPLDAMHFIARAAAAGQDDGEIAEELNRQGLRPVHARVWSAGQVAALRHHHRIAAVRPRKLSPRARPPAAQQPDGRYSVRGLAQHFGVSLHQVREWRRNGILQGPRAESGAPAWYVLDDATQQRIQRALERAQQRRRARPGASADTDPQPSEEDHG
jgi:DNA invertase Pin-like site-specific DNA recombinase